VHSAFKKHFGESWLVPLLACLGLAPLVARFGGLLWRHPAYQFYPLALAGAGILGWRAWSEFDGKRSSGPNRPVWILAGGTILVFLAGNVLWSPWLGFLALILFLATWCMNLGGRRALAVFLPALLMLASILPPPLGWDEALTLWLRSVSVAASSALLDFLQVVHTLEGNTILLPGKSLLVAEACSGINSVVLCIALSLFYTLWQRRPLVWLLFLVPATAAFVVLGNVIRITTGAALYYYWQVDWLSGWRHEVFGLALLLGYGVLVLSLDQLVFFCLHKTGGENGRKKIHEPSARVASASAPRLAGKISGWFLTVAGVVFFAARLLLHGSNAGGLVAEKDAPKNLQLTLPAELAGWRQLSDGPKSTLAETLGVHSLNWRFARDGSEATVAVDYPLVGFHNVKRCYLNNGWQVSDEQKILLDPGGTPFPAFRLLMQRSVCQHAVVFHAVLDERGDWLLPPARPDPWWARFFGAEPVAAPQTGYRIQVLAGAYTPLADQKVAGARELFMQASQLLHHQLVNQFSKPRQP
jgi:exosortase